MRSTSPPFDRLVAGGMCEIQGACCVTILPADVQRMLDYNSLHRCAAHAGLQPSPRMCSACWITIQTKCKQGDCAVKAMETCSYLINRAGFWSASTMSPTPTL